MQFGDWSSDVCSSDLQYSGPAEMVLERDSTGNTVPSTSVLAPTISAFDRPPISSGVLTDAPQINNPTVIQPVVPHLASNTTTVDGEDCVISLLSPSCGSTSGGEQIVLVIVNLPPSITLFARFGDNVVSTVRRKCLTGSRPVLIVLLVLPRPWCSHLYPTSGCATRYSRGYPLPHAVSRWTHLCDIAGQVHIRIRCQQSVRLSTKTT